MTRLLGDQTQVLVFYQLTQICCLLLLGLQSLTAKCPSGSAGSYDLECHATTPVGLTWGGLKLKYRASPAGRLRRRGSRGLRAQGASAGSGSFWPKAASCLRISSASLSNRARACSLSLSLASRLPASVARSSPSRWQRRSSSCNRVCCLCSNASSVACFSGVIEATAARPASPSRELARDSFSHRSGPSGNRTSINLSCWTTTAWRMG